MLKKDLAIGLCRVSSVEQLNNNSLNRQRDAVLKAASELDVTIPDKYWWSNSISSKRGTNLGRKDLKLAMEWCKKDKRIGYIIVDEPDRFMRSINEAAFFEVTFEQLGVKVWYASDPELNKGDLAAKLLKFTKYLSAEGSNEERVRKSISGQTKALHEGRYTFVPKPGYMKGKERGVHDIHPVRGPALRKVLIKLANCLITPTDALKELNESDFMTNHAHYKMDKFRKIITDPYYAGIVEISKQVKVRNENGRHEPLVTIIQHRAILDVMSSKGKNQGGPRKGGNPKYPCNNIISCDRCPNKKNGRVVGFDHGNGKPNSPIYEKYRCRACGTYLSREELHAGVEQQFKERPIIPEGVSELLRALDIVWKRNEDEIRLEAVRTQQRINSMEIAIGNQIEALADPANSLIQENIRDLIAKKKTDIKGLQDKLHSLNSKAESDKDEFLKFAFDFVDNMGSKFLEISPANRLRCKQVVFPAGFRLSEGKKVYTPEISPLYGLATKKKDAEASMNSHLVRVRGL